MVFPTLLPMISLNDTKKVHRTEIHLPAADLFTHHIWLASTLVTSTSIPLDWIHS